jgi:hypothetical protein
MNGLLDQVVLTQADRRGRHARPVSDRTKIVLCGGTFLLASSRSDVPTQVQVFWRADGFVLLQPGCGLYRDTRKV